MTPSAPAHSPQASTQAVRKRLLAGAIVLLLLAAPLGVWAGIARAQRNVSGDGATTMQAANALYTAGQYGVAAQAYQQLVDQGYGGRALLYNRGVAQLEAGDAPAAVESLRSAQRAYPRDTSVRTALAEAERRARMNAPMPNAPEAAATAPVGTTDSLPAHAAAAPGRLVQLRLRWISGTEAALLALLLWTLLAALILLALAAPRAGAGRRLATAAAIVIAPLLGLALILLAA